jgi:hypothetical protein
MGTIWVDYVGKRYGLVTVISRKGQKTWVKCDCGCVRSASISNLINAPPKSHNKCTELQYELPLDSPRTDVYEKAS